MFENIMKFFKNMSKKQKNSSNSKDTAKERLHLVLMQDRANVSADFLDLMRQEIIDVIKKYIEVDESAIDVRLTNKENEDGTTGAPALYANIPIINIKEEAKKEEDKIVKEKKEENSTSKENETSKKVDKQNDAQKTENDIENHKDKKESKKDSVEDNKQENSKNQDNVKKENQSKTNKKETKRKSSNGDKQE